MDRLTHVAVAVPRPIDRTFIYRVPPELAAEARPGMRAVVPFGRRELVGWIDREVERPTRLERVRDILDLPDPTPLLDAHLLDLCRWIALYYVAPLGLVFRAVLPAALSSESRDALRWVGGAADDLSPLERELARYLESRAGAVRISTVRKALGPRGWWAVARRLAERELLTIEHEAPDTEPALLRRTVVRAVRDLPSLRERDRIFGRATRQREMFEYLESVGGDAELAHLTAQLGFSRSVARGLAEKGLVEIAEEVQPRDPFRDAPPEAPPSLTPTDAQRAAVEAILKAADRTRPGVCVLQGVTGSGKTLVYIEVLKEIVLRRGRSAIVLVPEIALTPQAVARFRAVFGDRVAVLHSALSEGERYDAWRSLRDGRKTIAIGARSAVFAPVPNLGAVILDEEHEATYKQNDPIPRYHAREVALVRADRAGAVAVLGSATPSLETWAHVRSGRWTLLRLPLRIANRPLPPVRVVDLREERRRRDAEANGAGRGGPVILSRELDSAIRECLERGEQAILLLNRRGYATFLQCRACGFVKTCPNCSVSLVYHRRPEHLLCHHCSHTEIVPRACPECGSDALAFAGVGTQHVERVLGEHFPRARVARMDVDTTSRKWSHQEILERVERGEVDLLLGTQMIAKGLDFPNVTLVGVIHADVAIHLPDFRASERTFQLLTQVAGRAGRGPKLGRVIVQTALPDHYAIRHAVGHDYEGFAERETEERREPAYPPHCRLGNVVFSGLDEPAVADAALESAHWIRRRIHEAGPPGLRVVGPAPAPITRVRNRYRWHLLLKAQEPKGLGAILRLLARRPAAARPKDVRIEIDRDPGDLL